MKYNGSNTAICCFWEKMKVISVTFSFIALLWYLWDALDLDILSWWKQFVLYSVCTGSHVISLCLYMNGKQVITKEPLQTGSLAVVLKEAPLVVNTRNTWIMSFKKQPRSRCHATVTACPNTRNSIVHFTHSS